MLTIRKRPSCWIFVITVLLAACGPVSTATTEPPTATPTPIPTASPTPTIVWFPPTPTRTPFPTSTALPPTPDMRPGLGGIIFQDDFNTGEAWALNSTAKGSVALGKNKLTIAISASKSYLSSLRSQPIVGDFYAEITASPNLCRGSDEYGLLIRAASEQDYYRFSVSCDGQTRLDRVYQGTASSPQPWMLASMVPVGSPSTIRLAVWGVGKEMRFFINDEYQFTVRDPLLPSGRLGVFARSAGNTAVTVNFSNLVIWGIGGSAGTTAPSMTPSPTEIPTPAGTATIPAEARLHLQCLQVSPVLTDGMTSNGIVVLESRVDLGNGRYSPDTFLLNMSTGEATQIALQDEHQVYHFVSPNKKLLAYESVIFTKQDEIIREGLVIAKADGQRQKVIPSEKGWTGLLGWLDNQRVVINLSALDPEESTMKKPSTLLVMNPLSGERQILRPDYPQYYDKSFTIYPDWEGWGGVVYDPTLTRAIYPRLIGENDENYTYALWDLSKKQLVTTLEDIFSDYSGDNIYPMPVWSPHGSQFVVEGLVDFPDHVEREIYLVSKDGNVKQLTHLYPYGCVLTDNYSWSPDGRYIAMYLATKDVGFPKAKVVVVDTETLDITDYCLPVTYGGEGYGLPSVPPSSPVWSPDGTQFLVVDWHSADHQSVILVDIAQGFAAKIAEDMEPVGWMVSP